MMPVSRSECCLSASATSLNVPEEEEEWFSVGSDGMSDCCQSHDNELNSSQASSLVSKRLRNVHEKKNHSNGP